MVRAFGNGNGNAGSIPLKLLAKSPPAKGSDRAELLFQVVGAEMDAHRRPCPSYIARRRLYAPVRWCDAKVERDVERRSG